MNDKKSMVIISDWLIVSLVFVILAAWTLKNDHVKSFNLLKSEISREHHKNTYWTVVGFELIIAIVAFYLALL